MILVCGIRRNGRTPNVRRACALSRTDLPTSRTSAVDAVDLFKIALHDVVGMVKASGQRDGAGMITCGKSGM